MEYELRTIGQWSYHGFPGLDRVGVSCGFMTSPSQAILTDPAQREAFAKALSAKGVIVLNQVHGSDVHVVASGEKPATGDGLVLFETGVIGVVKTADCLPVILYEQDGQACAIVHAGWRGTVSGIAGKAVAAMAGRGLTPDRLGALVGPGIGPCCYNVGADVVAAFRQAGFYDDIFEERDGSTFLDLRRANRHVLMREGVARVDEVDLCTSCRTDLFFSARRGFAGRQVNFVLMRNAATDGS